MNTTDIVVPPVTIATSSTGTHTEKDEYDNDHPGEGKKEGGGEGEVQGGWHLYKYDAPPFIESKHYA